VDPTRTAHPECIDDRLPAQPAAAGRTRTLSGRRRAGPL